MIEYRDRITRQMMRNEPDKLFVFGDNMARFGLGGQAKEMRGEPNAVGIPTKHSPSTCNEAYFRDSDFDSVRSEIERAFARLSQHDGVIVWPKDGIGTGLADLPRKSPRIWRFIESGRIKLASM